MQISWSNATSADTYRQYKFWPAGHPFIFGRHLSEESLSLRLRCARFLALRITSTLSSSDDLLFASAAQMMAHRGHPTARTKTRWQPYTNSTPSGRSPATTHLNTPQKPSFLSPYHPPTLNHLANLPPQPPSRLPHLSSPKSLNQIR